MRWVPHNHTQYSKQNTQLWDKWVVNKQWVYTFGSKYIKYTYEWFILVLQRRMDQKDFCNWFCNEVLILGVSVSVWVAMRSCSNGICREKFWGRLGDWSSWSGGWVRLFQPFERIEVAQPSNPMCVTCFISVGHPISIPASPSSISSFSNEIECYHHH